MYQRQYPPRRNPVLHREHDQIRNQMSQDSTLHDSNPPDSNPLDSKPHSPKGWGWDWVILWGGATVALGVGLSEPGVWDWLRLEGVQGVQQVYHWVFMDAVGRSWGEQVLSGHGQWWVMVVAMGFTFLLKLVVPQPGAWARAIATLLLLFLGTRYGLWRLTQTLNLDTPVQATWSLVLLFAEGLGLFSGLASSGLAIAQRDRRREADWGERVIQNGDYAPTVDVLIPTYNEPPEILRRTVMGCQAMTYPNKYIYLLDDQRRPEIKALAAQLGCEYRDRPDNRHAKAGNINHALPSLRGELIAVFDADYVPSRNFLNRTLGFFVEPQVAMVQTPQNFFNDDPVSVNLGLTGVVNNEQNFFFRHIQSSRDAFNAVICCGSCFVVRRQALDEIGGVPTESIAEDMFTSIQLQARGYEIKYLNEALSAGLSAENMGAYLNQRLRWGRGTLQSLFSRTNVLSLPGLTGVQRLYHALSVIYWLQAIPRLLFLVVPITYFGLGLTPLKVNFSDLVQFYLPYFVANSLTFSWMTGGWRSMVWSEVYETLTCVPMVGMILNTIVNPFGKGFKVTPKGVNGDRLRVNWVLIGPLAIILVLTLAGALMAWQQRPWLNMPGDLLLLNLGWLIYNCMLLLVAILAAIDIPQRKHPRFVQEWPCQVHWGVPGYSAVTMGRSLNWSEAGVAIALDDWEGVPTVLPEVVTLVFSARSTPSGQSPSPLGGVPVRARWCWGERQGQRAQVGFAFGGIGETNAQRIPDQPLADKVYRGLIEALFCEPGQWRDQRVPEYRTAWAFVGSLLRLYPLARGR